MKKRRWIVVMMWTMPQKLKWSFYSSPIYSPTSMYKLHRKSRHGTWVSSTLNPHQTPTTDINKPNHCFADEIMCKNNFVNWKIPINIKDEFRKHWCCFFLNSASLQCAMYCAKCFLECCSLTPPHHCSEEQAQSWWSPVVQKGFSSVCWAGCGVCESVVAKERASSKWNSPYWPSEIPEFTWVGLALPLCPTWKKIYAGMLVVFRKILCLLR